MVHKKVIKASNFASKETKLKYIGRDRVCLIIRDFTVGI